MTAHCKLTLIYVKGPRAEFLGAPLPAAIDVRFVPKADILFTRQVFEDTAESTL